MKKAFLITYLICLICVPCSRQALAIQTQVNEVTDLFDKNIENKDELLLDMKTQSDNAHDLIKSGQHHEGIVGIEESANKASELNSISESDLENAGRVKRISKEYQFYDENELEPDYTKSGNRMHKLDAGTIVDATEKTMKSIGIDLMKRLIELGFNCKTVKGAIHKDPTYYIEIKRKEEKNTQYDQFFCEEPRNIYNCYDSLTLQCLNKTSGEKANATIRINRNEMPSHWWIGRGNDGGMSYGYTTNFFLVFNAGVMEEVKQKIIEKTGNKNIEVPPQEIMIFGGQQVLYQLNETGEVGKIQNTWHPNPENISDSIRFFYYVPGEHQCIHWQEDWSERCALK